MTGARGARHPAVVSASRLHRARHRRETGLTLIEGPHLLEEALAAGVVPTQVFAAVDDAATVAIATRADLEVIPVDHRALGRLAGTETPRGPVAVIGIPADRVDRARSILVAWGVSDPGNVGAVVRVAAAFGWGFASTPGAADPWSPKALRAGAGGQFRTPVVRVESMDGLDAWDTVATVPAGGTALDSLADGPWAVLIGEEALGLPESVAAACAHQVTIPMPGGIESLNAAVAAGIVVYELSKY